jgi:hypothetical protein
MTEPRIAVLLPCYNEEAAIAQTVAGFRGSTRVLQQCGIAAGTRQAASSMSISVCSLSAVRVYGAPRMLVSAKGSRAFSSNLELVLRQVDSALATVKNAQDIIMAGLPSALCTHFSTKCRQP